MRLSLLLTAVLLLGASPAAGPNGFTVENATVPINEILRGGPPRDGIPALYDPETLAASEATWEEEEVVLGIVIAGSARAYPVGILNWHELVNDTLGGQEILVSYCPLCATGIVFDRRLDERVRRFGVSGLLYKSDLLLYDRETGSLWSQIAGKAISGPAVNTRLRILRSQMESWGRWKRKHPETTVLSTETGHDRDYTRSPYGDYALSPRVLFSEKDRLDPRYHPKMPTLGVRLPSGPARAYPAAELVHAGGQVRETFEGHAISVAYDSESQVFSVEAPGELEVIEGYWFAWAAFHPDTSVFVFE